MNTFFLGHVHQDVFGELPAIDSGEMTSQKLIILLLAELVKQMKITNEKDK